MKTTLSLNLNKPEIFPESRPTETRPAGKFRAPPATGPRAPPRAAGAPRGANGGRWTHRGRPRPRRRLASAAPREPRAPHVGRTGPAGPTAGDRAPAGASPPPAPGSHRQPRSPEDDPRPSSPWGLRSCLGTGAVGQRGRVRPTGISAQTQAALRGRSRTQNRSDRPRTEPVGTSVIQPRTMPAPTVSWVKGSTKISDPVARLRR